MRKLVHLFCDHPRSMKETYFQHFAFATKCGLKMIGGGIGCFLHGIFPFIFLTTGSRTVDTLHKKMHERQDKSQL